MSNAPLIRKAVGMLYVAMPPSNRLRNHSRSWANDKGTNAGRGWVVSGATPAVGPPMRGSSWAMVGASKAARTGRLVSKAALTADISCIADSESPPNSKNESSTPTRSTPRTWA
ncbi:hypothetical protein MYIN104542_29520 [Mycobacterium intermedium]